MGSPGWVRDSLGLGKWKKSDWSEKHEEEEVRGRGICEAIEESSEDRDLRESGRCCVLPRPSSYPDRRNRSEDKLHILPGSNEDDGGGFKSTWNASLEICISWMSYTLNYEESNHQPSHSPFCSDSHPSSQQKCISYSNRAPSSIPSQINHDYPPSISDPWLRLDFWGHEGRYWASHRKSHSHTSDS